MLWTIDVGWSAFFLTIVGIILLLVLWKKRGTTKGGLLLGALNTIMACISIYALSNFIVAYDSTAFCLFISGFAVALVLETIQGTTMALQKQKKEPKAKKARNWGASKKEEKKVEPITFP